MAFAPNVWNQIKNLTADDIKKALERDGYKAEAKSGAILGFYKAGRPATPTTPAVPANRVTVHYHPKKTYGAKLLQGLIDDIGWTENDLRRLKLIK